MPTILLSEALKKTPKERKAIIDDPDCDIIDDRQGVPIQALSREEHAAAKRLLAGAPLTDAAEEQLGTTHDRYQKPNEPRN